MSAVEKIKPQMGEPSIKIGCKKYLQLRTMVKVGNQFLRLSNLKLREPYIIGV